MLTFLGFLMIFTLGASGWIRPNFNIMAFPSVMLFSLIFSQAHNSLGRFNAGTLHLVFLITFIIFLTPTLFLILIVDLLFLASTPSEFLTQICIRLICSQPRRKILVSGQDFLNFCFVLPQKMTTQKTLKVSEFFFHLVLDISCSLNRPKVG